MRNHAIVVAVVSFSLVSLSAAVAAVGPSGGTTPDVNGRLPDNDRARGLVFDGLRPADAGSPCAGGYEVVADHVTQCTHGPDAAPDDVDVREPRSVAELQLDTRALQAAPVAIEGMHVHADGANHDHGFAHTAGQAGDAPTTSTTTEAGAVPVIGDGVSGNRVQAVYAVSSDRTDRFDSVAPLITTWAAHVDAMVNQSAALTGGERHARFVTDTTGALSIAKVVLPPNGDDTFDATISALRAAGYDSPTRKYLIWTDASVYCGIGTIYADDRPGQDNANNGRYAMYSRVDTGCWGKANSTELHEIVHNMGGVQQSAPHVTPGWHCSDDYDRMCYRDSSSVVMTYGCPSSMEALLDCGHDDYFNTSPPPGSYLDENWNVADSSFLHVGPVGDPPPPPPPPPTNTAPLVSATAPTSVILGTSAAVNGTVTDDGLPGPYTVSWSKTSGPGQATFANAAADDTTVAFSTAGTYQLTLTANDGELAASAAVTISVTEPEPVNQAPAVTAVSPSSIVLGDAAALEAIVSDDGIPGPPTVVWTTKSGPGQATFADPQAEQTTASFPVVGTYELAVTADDGQLTGSATVTIQVGEPAPPTPVTATFSGTLNKKWPERSYDTSLATGPVTATLSFSGNGGGRKATSPELTLTAYDAAGTVVATTSGPSALQLSLELSTGVYRWAVSGANTSFTLDVTHLP